MTTDRNPQAEQMADESMVRNLAAQAEALWPQERKLLAFDELPADARVLDVGCGSGEAIARLAQELPDARFLGIDLHEPHLAIARERLARLGDRVEFRTGDAFELALEDASFDLVLCRHMLQAVPRVEQVLGEMQRVTKPGGRLHLVAEDYAMIHFDPADAALEQFFLDGPCTFARKTGTDLLSGRKMPHLLRSLGLEDVRMDYATLDTERVPRETLAAVFAAWGDGYTDCIASETRLSLEEVRQAFDQMVSAVLDPAGYAVWHVPVVSARKPRG